MTHHELQLLSDFHQEAVEIAANRRLEDDPRHQAWCTVKRVTWMVLLAGAFLFFYLISKMHEALALL
jgi:hypothetical protein